MNSSGQDGPYRKPTPPPPKPPPLGATVPWVLGGFGLFLSLISCLLWDFTALDCTARWFLAVAIFSFGGALLIVIVRWEG